MILPAASAPRRSTRRIRTTTSARPHLSDRRSAPAAAPHSPRPAPCPTSPPARPARASATASPVQATASSSTAVARAAATLMRTPAAPRPRMSSSLPRAVVKASSSADRGPYSSASAGRLRTINPSHACLLIRIATAVYAACENNRKMTYAGAFFCSGSYFHDDNNPHCLLMMLRR